MLSRLLLANVPFVIAMAALHRDWVLAIVGAGVPSSLPLPVVRSKPGSLGSALTIAAAFMGYAALLIQESHGATESHFYIFVLLAFLIVYRDWRVPVFGGLVIAVHHVVFYLVPASGTGVWVFPASMARMGVRLAGVEMVAIHAAFVVLEVAVLVYMGRSMAAETRSQAALLVEQEGDRVALVALAEELQARDLTVGADDRQSRNSAAINTLCQASARCRPRTDDRADRHRRGGGVDAHGHDHRRGPPGKHRDRGLSLPDGHRRAAPGRGDRLGPRVRRRGH
jgi:hypothetical protein